MVSNEQAFVPAAQVVVLPPGKRPRGRPPTHGVYSKYKLGPLTEVKSKEILEIISGQRLMLAPSDYIIVDLLSRTLAQVELISRHLDEHGLFQDDADGKSRGAVTPLVASLFSAIKVASKLCDQLGLTPDARVRLGKGVAQADDIASRIARAREA